MQTKELIKALRKAEGSEALRGVYLGQLNAEMICKKAADALAATLWRPNTQKPAKPGISSYEYVDCWIVKDGKVIERPWNCEHECFDDQEYDDWFCNMEDVSAWMPIVKPAPPEAE